MGARGHSWDWEGDTAQPLVRVVCCVAIIQGKLSSNSKYCDFYSNHEVGYLLSKDMMLCVRETWWDGQEARVATQRSDRWSVARRGRAQAGSYGCEIRREVGDRRERGDQA